MTKIKVVSLSILYENPYRDLFIDHLISRDVEVVDYYPKIIFIPQLIKQEKPNIIHLHTLHYFLAGRNQTYRFLKFIIFISQIFLLRLMGIKTVWTVHEWADKWGDNRNHIPLVWAVIIGRLFHAIITHCDTTKNEIVKALRLENEDKVFVVLHGNYIGCYENKISQVEARKFLDISEEKLIFLLFGNILHNKGFLEAIDAFNELQKQDTFLLIAGYPGEEQIEELIKDKIKESQNILFIPGKVPNEKIQLFINACDCVIVPYKVFTTSGVTILTMSFGRACMAPRMGFFSDVLDDFGSFLYNFKCEDGLFNAMQLAVEKKSNLSAMGKHNLNLAEQWSWDYVAKETIKVYQQCLGLAP